MNEIVYFGNVHVWSILYAHVNEPKLLPVFESYFNTKNSTLNSMRLNR